MEKNIMVDMSATLIHHGHIRLLKKASKYGKVIVGLTSDNEVRAKKGYTPLLSFAQRKEILLAINYVNDVVEVPWFINDAILQKYNIDLLVHGDDNSNNISKEKLLLFPRTKGISSSQLYEGAVSCLFAKRNNEKIMYTPGPAVILPENILGLKPVFGRGDNEYKEIETFVLEKIKKLAGQDNIIRLQGSATLAIELAIKSFIYGRVLLVTIGHYSNRLKDIISKTKLAVDVEVVHYNEIDTINNKYDWLLTVYTETSHAFKIDIEKISLLSKKIGAKLFLDATGSIGLEDNHNVADVMAFSSCKGLFGLVGAGFVTFNNNLDKQDIDSYYLNLDLQYTGGVTGPYHAICSLYQVLDKIDFFRQKVSNLKKQFIDEYKDNITVSDKYQPLLCTHINIDFKSNLSVKKEVFYTPRSEKYGSIVCHLYGAN